MTPHPHATSDLHPAEVGVRLGAGAIDLFILFIQWNAIVFLFSVAGLLVSIARRALGLGVPLPTIERGLFLTGWVWSLTVIAVYFPYWWRRGGQTFGMRLLNVRVVTVDGQTLTWPRAIVRWLGLALLAIGWLWIMVDERKQTWHDKLAGTLVISSKGHLQR